MRNVKTTKELYAKLIEMPNLHSIPELNGEVLIWKLYKDAYVRAYCDSYDTCIDIISNSVFTGSLIHWHPDEDDMLDELYTLGKKGNMLVLKKALLGTSIFHSGPSESFPLADRMPLHFGKKKWDGGQLVYLEQR